MTEGNYRVSRFVYLYMLILYLCSQCNGTPHQQLSATMSTPPRRSNFASKSLPLRRLRADSGNILAQDALTDLSEAEINSIIPPHPIYKIVMTGGPCGGKTTCLERLSNYLRERGFEVITW